MNHKHVCYTILGGLFIVFGSLDIGCYLSNDMPLSYGRCVRWQTADQPGGNGYVPCEDNRGLVTSK